MYIYLQQALPRVVIHLTQAVEKKWKLRVRFSPTKVNRVHERRSRRRLTKKVSRLRCLGQDKNKKIPVIECLAFCV